MSACKHTTLIPSNQCVGDSLKTINSNFANLDQAVCSVPTLIETDSDIYLTPKFDELKYPKIQISTTSSPTFYKRLENYNSSVKKLTAVHFINEFQTRDEEVYEFPYNSSVADISKKPIGTFDCISNGRGTPQITLLWSCSSSTPSENVETVYALNSSVSFFDTGEISPNNYVSTFYEEIDKGLLYIGGAFTKIGGTICNKLAVINLTGGKDFELLGSVGSAIRQPFKIQTFDLGEEGDVTFIQKKKLQANNKLLDLVIVAGSFRSSIFGRSLTIWDETTPHIRYPFYVNGPIHNCLIDQNFLYIAGYFDFLNYGAGPQPENSGQRIYTKSLARINLSSLANLQNEQVIDREFCETFSQNFNGSVELMSLARHGECLYVGGEFKAEKNGLLLNRNLLSIFLTGELNPFWKIVVDKPVRALLIDNPLSFLYVGGDFTRIVPQRDVYNNIFQQFSSETAFSTAAAFDVSISKTPVITNWRPKFNGSVKKFEREDPYSNSYIYALGDFTQINETSVDYVAALTKATNTIGNNENGNVVKWSVYLPSPTPQQSPITNALLKNKDTILIGGNFARINNQQRLYFARVGSIKSTSLRPIQQEVVWDVGMKILGGNEPYLFDFNNTLVFRGKGFCVGNGSIQKTTIKIDNSFFRDIFPKQYCRFFIKRPGSEGANKNVFLTDDTFQESIYLHGWFVQFVNS